MANIQERLIKENKHVLLKKGNSLKVIRAEKDRNVVFDKRTFCLNAALNQPFGTIWEVNRNIVVPAHRTETLQGEVQSSGDNRDIQDDTGSQRLDRDDIMSLKEQGMSGEGIVEQLVDNSSTFTNKTAYSQAKYLKKKKEKYITRFTIYKPNIRLLCQLFFNKIPNPKIICLREDTLAQLLTCTNLQPGSKVMVVENCQGLLMASVMERLAGSGTIVQFHSEDRPVVIAEELLDLPNEYQDIALRMQLRAFNKVLQGEDSTCLKDAAVQEGDTGGEPMDTHPTRDNRDVRLEDTPETKHTGDVQLEDTHQTKHTGDVGLEDTHETKHTGDVQLEETHQTKHTGDVGLEDTHETKHTGDVQLEDTHQTKHTGDVGLEDTHETKHTSDVQLKDTHQTKHTGDVRLEDTRETKHTSDVQLEGMHQTKHTGDVRLEDTHETKHTSDVRLENAHETKHTGDVGLDDTEEKKEESQTYQRRKRDFKGNPKRRKRQVIKAEVHRKIKEVLERRDMDSLLIACRFQPVLLLNRLLEYLAPSRTFVVYSNLKEPLVECFKQLKDNRGVINMSLTETWLRHYQVLDNRTHPMTTMNGTGGYVLTGTKVCDV